MTARQLIAWLQKEVKDLDTEVIVNSNQPNRRGVLAVVPEHGFRFNEDAAPITFSEYYPYDPAYPDNCPPPAFRRVVLLAPAPK